MGVLKLTWHENADNPMVLQDDKTGTPWIQIDISQEMLDNVIDEYNVFQDAAALLGKKLYESVKEVK